jgi:hypothetical protein
MWESVLASKALEPVGPHRPKKPQPKEGRRMSQGNNDVVNPNSRPPNKWLLGKGNPGELPSQQAQKPAADQSDFDATGNADPARIGFSDVHEHSTDHAPHKSPEQYFHSHP